MWKNLSATIICFTNRLVNVTSFNRFFGNKDLITLMLLWVKITSRHLGNSPVTFFTHKRLALYRPVAYNTLKTASEKGYTFFCHHAVTMLVTDSLWHSHIFYVTYCKVFRYIQPYKHIAHCYLGNLEYTLLCHRRWSYPFHSCSVRKTTTKTRNK